VHWPHFPHFPHKAVPAHATTQDLLHPTRNAEIFAGSLWGLLVVSLAPYHHLHMAHSSSMMLIIQHTVLHAVHPHSEVQSAGAESSTHSMR